MKLGTGEIILILVIIVVPILIWRRSQKQKNGGIVKKIFGFLFLLIGLLMIGTGIATVTQSATQDNTIEGRIGNTFSQEYREQNQEKRIVGFGLAGGGLLFFIIGIVMIATKTNKQRENEIELEVIKKMQLANNFTQPEQTNTKQAENAFVQKSTDDKIGQIEKLGKLKEQGLLTDEEFQQQKKKILES
jgi:NADH:ubiquinone oxidoreductase subunit 6 (subunit J)